MSSIKDSKDEIEALLARIPKPRQKTEAETVSVALKPAWQPKPSQRGLCDGCMTDWPAGALWNVNTGSEFEPMFKVLCPRCRLGNS
jgi:hypothetical protein